MLSERNSLHQISIVSHWCAKLQWPEVQFFSDPETLLLLSPMIDPQPPTLWTQSRGSRHQESWLDSCLFRASSVEQLTFVTLLFWESRLVLAWGCIWSNLETPLMHSARHDQGLLRCLESVLWEEALSQSGSQFPPAPSCSPVQFSWAAKHFLPHLPTVDLPPAGSGLLSCLQFNICIHLRFPPHSHTWSHLPHPLSLHLNLLVMYPCPLPLPQHTHCCSSQTIPWRK